MMRFDSANEQYEQWLAARVPLIQADLRRKHALMGGAPFPFLRATFFRWAQMWPVLCPDQQTAPEVLAVGDLHVENFGTWRDADGRLVWGINDFDEAEWMPYTCDLVRLATSAHLAINAGHLKIAHASSCKAILDGYRASLRAGGRPLVLAEDHPALRAMAVERLKDPSPFWRKLEAFPELKSVPPSGALKALRKMLPSSDLAVRLSHRIAGLGSLGRQRYLALASFEGGYVAREAKQLTDSAWLWAWPPGKGAPKARIHYQQILERSIRCHDPFVRLRGDWIARRLAPDCSRIELASLPAKHDATRLFRAMGWETANVHLGTCDAKALLADVRSRRDEWLHESSKIMVAATEKDWRSWKSRTPGERS
jgi:hypothetical protein